MMKLVRLTKYGYYIEMCKVNSREEALRLIAKNGTITHTNGNIINTERYTYEVRW